MRNKCKEQTKYVSNSVCALAILEIILMLSSWIISTAFPATRLRSLINSEGIRWFLGCFTDNLGNDFSIWLLLSAMAYGCISKSKILALFKDVRVYKSMEFRKRLAVVLVVVEIFVVLVVMSLLTFSRQAILLSVTGELFPSSFSRSLIPVVDFTLVVTAITYGLVTDNIRSLDDIVDCLVCGCQKASPLFVIYVFACQFIYSVGYVFSL